MTPQEPVCANCRTTMKKRRCMNPEAAAPPCCPTETCTELVEQSVADTLLPGTAEFARAAAVQEGVGYDRTEPGWTAPRPVKPRLLEVVEFARRMGYERLGLAFCVGLAREANTVARFFSAHGFTMYSAACKAGCVPKEDIGLKDEEKIVPGGFESMCNPVLQARLLNRAETQFNVMLGLCVGHDSLFLKNADAPCTVLAVKDRVLGHNPLAAVYQIEAYYRGMVPEEE